jgi:hypothetical protein
MWGPILTFSSLRAFGNLKWPLVATPARKRGFWIDCLILIHGQTCKRKTLRAAGAKRWFKGMLRCETSRGQGDESEWEVEAEDDCDQQRRQAGASPIFPRVELHASYSVKAPTLTSSVTCIRVIGPSRFCGSKGAFASAPFQLKSQPELPS